MSQAAPASQPEPLPDPQPIWIRLLNRWARPLLLIYWPALSIAVHWPRLQIAGDAVWKSDKFLHFACYAWLAILMIYARLLGRKASWQANIVAGAVLAASWSLIDEFTQDLVGRNSSTSDLLANFIGIGAAFVAASLTPPRPRLSNTIAWTCRLVALGLGPLVVFQLFTEHPLSAFSGSYAYEAFGVAIRKDYVGHLLLGFGGFWVLYGARVFGRVPRLVNLLAIGMPLAMAAWVIEYFQASTGREVDRMDLLSHLAGVGSAAAICLLWIIVTAIHRRQRRPMPDDAAPAPAAGQEDHAPAPGGEAFVGHAMLVSGLTLVSRFTGLIRDAVIIACFGLGGISDAFYLGFKIPNLFRRLFGEGALSAAFIPLYTEKLRQDPRLARRLASACLALQLIVLGGLTVAAEFALRWMLDHYTWTDDSSLAIRLTMLMLPYMPMVCAVAIMGGVLQVHRRFGAPAATPIILNLTLIFFTLFATEKLRDVEALRLMVLFVALAVVLAGVFQLLWITAAMLRVEGISLNFRGVGRPLKQMLWMMLPMLVGLAVFQVNAFADSLIAWVLSPKNGLTQITLLGYTFDPPIPSQGAVAALELAQRLYQFPLGVFGIAIATAIFPAFARAAADETDTDRDAFRRILHQGLRLTVFIGLPASIGLILVRLPLVRLLFEYQRFSLEDSQRVAIILTGYAAGVWAYSLTHVLTRAFYAVKDVRTPLVVSLVMVTINLALNMTLVWFLGAAGLAWSTAISAAMQAVLLLVLIRGHVSQPVSGRVVAAWRRMIAITLAMAAAIAPIGWFCDVAAMSARQSALVLLVQLLLGAGVYLALAKLMGMQELRWLRSRGRADA